MGSFRLVQSIRRICGWNIGTAELTFSLTTVAVTKACALPNGNSCGSPASLSPNRVALAEPRRFEML
jgi:hypothetical protein